MTTRPTIMDLGRRGPGVPGATGAGLPGTGGPRTYKVEGNRRVRAHPAADAFRLLDDDGTQALADDILRHGQLVPVVLQKREGGDLVVDGRCRLLACELVDITPRVGYLRPDEDPVEYVISTNLVRRHESPSLRALAAARLSTLCGPGRPSANASLNAITQAEAGRQLCISRTLVTRAKAILGHPILVAAVESEVVSVSDAWKIRQADEDAQRQAVQIVSAGAAPTLEAALAQLTRTGAAGVASDPTEGSPAGRSESGPPVAEPTETVETSQESRSGPPSAASGHGPPDGASAAARHPDAAQERAASDPSSSASPDTPTPRARSGDTPAGTASDAARPGASGAAGTADDAATELRRALDDVGHALTGFLSGGEGSPQRLRAACVRLEKVAAAVRRSLDAMDDEPEGVVNLQQQQARGRDLEDPRFDFDADADSETANG